MPHATPTVDVAYLKAALEYSDAQLSRAQEEIWRLRAALEKHQHHLDRRYSQVSLGSIGAP